MALANVLQAAALTRTRRRVRIEYCDASGELSHRVIEPLRMFTSRYGETYVRAFCRLRGEERTFRLDRIRSWEVLGAGEDGSQPTGLPAAVHAEPAAVQPESAASAAAPAAAAAVPAAVRAAPLAAATPAAFLAPPQPQPAARPRRGRRLRRALVWALVLYLGGRWALEGASPGQSLGELAAAVGGLFVAPQPAPLPAPAPRSTPRPAPLPARPNPAPQPPAPAPLPRPAPPPPPEPVRYTTLTYRGQAIAGATQGGRSAWAVASLGVSFPTLWEAQAAISAEAFQRATGIDSPELLRLYANADSDRDGALSWAELRSFQRALRAAYAYRSNLPALRPDEFLAEGGGDCEDWALVTCGLLRFWGRRAWVGSIGPAHPQAGHAVCLVPVAALPPGMSGFEVAGLRTAEGEPVPDGLYVPVDYDVVGGLTNAVEEGWELREMYVPESIYGRTM